MTPFRPFLAGLTAAAVVVLAQQPTAPRGTQSQVFLEMRQMSAQTKAAPKAVEKGKAAVSKAPAPSAAAKQLGDAFLGVNLWRMKPADTSAPVKIRGLKHRTDPSGTRDWTPERVDFGQVFVEDGHVRVSLESAREGYLYVVNRDVFADGSKSPPTIIFPTKRIKGGNNLVQPGVPVEIPAFSDNPPAFHVERLLPNQTGIELLMLVTKRPLGGLTIPEDQETLPEAMVAQWERDWGSQVERTEDPTLVGKVYTMAERSAAADAAKPLGTADAVPVTLYYRRGAAGQPMLAKGVIQVRPAVR